MFSIVIPARPVQPVQSWKDSPNSGAKIAATKSGCPVCRSNWDNNKVLPSLHDSSNPCADCPSNPANNPDASGICHCMLGRTEFR